MTYLIDEIYFIKIIDTLTSYDFKKRSEQLIKSLIHDPVCNGENKRKKGEFIKISWCIFIFLTYYLEWNISHGPRSLSKKIYEILSQGYGMKQLLQVI